MSVLRLFCWALLFVAATSSDSDYDDVCSFIGGDSGNCLPLKDCKPLLNLIKRRPLLKKDLGLLVKLTCEFHLETPKVCCPLEEDVYIDSEEVGVVPPPQPPSPPLPSDHNPSFRNHRNFGKLPSFEKCSLSLSSYLRKARLGKQTFRGQFPWVALLGYTNATSGRTEFLCSGTVINKRNVLTSAQCTNLPGYGRPTNVRLAEHDLRSDPDCFNAAELGCSTVQEIPVKEITVHPLLNFTAAKKGLNFEHDVAVIGLGRDITFDIYIQPICLPFVKDYDLISFPKRLHSVSSAFSAGWQNSFCKSRNKSVLELSSFPIRPNEECGTQYFPQPITANQICAGSEVRTPCCGHVGSALMISHTERSMPKYFQVGIASHGPFHCRQHPVPGIFTRITSYLHFILDSLHD